MSDHDTPPKSETGGRIQEERRKEPDRRASGRQGKYDRRRNRCVQCVHFKEEDKAGKGLCTYHNLDMVSYAFACLQFTPPEIPADEQP
jgi:hypothetical protein